MQIEQSAIAINKISNLPSMTYEEKIERRDEKQAKILNFLADYEVFTTVQVVAMLLEVSQSSARRALEQLVAGSMLISEDHYIDGHSVKLYGITHAGLIACEAEPEAPYFEKGKIKSHYIQHKLETQRVRIIAEKIGAFVIPERKIRIDQKGLKKIPDAIMNLYLNDQRVPGSRICIEVEREPKIARRLNVVNKNYLHAMEVDEQIDCVLYLYPQKFLGGAIKLMHRLEQPECPAGLETLRPYRYMYGALENFPHGIRFADGTAVDFTAQVIPAHFE